VTSGTVVRAFDRALRLLAVRPHFRAELRRKLLDKLYDESEVEAALERLAALGHLDDEALAAAEGERLRQRRALASSAVRAELARKGAPREAIAAAAGGDDAASELARALGAGRRWLAGGRRDSAALARHLDRKGYPRHVIFRVLNELMPEAGTPEELD